MSREQYTPPTLASNPPTGGVAGGSAFSNSSSSGGAANAAIGSAGSAGSFGFTGIGPPANGAGSYDDTSRPVQYLCGDCDSKVVLKKGDAIRCKECGYRVLYKERTTKMVQFEAR